MGFKGNSVLDSGFFFVPGDWFGMDWSESDVGGALLAEIRGWLWGARVVECGLSWVILFSWWRYWGALAFYWLGWGAGELLYREPFRRRARWYRCGYEVVLDGCLFRVNRFHFPWWYVSIRTYDPGRVFDLSVPGSVEELEVFIRGL